MQSFAAVFRTQETLEEGCKLIDEVYTSYRDGLQVHVSRPCMLRSDVVFSLRVLNCLFSFFFDSLWINLAIPHNISAGFWPWYDLEYWSNWSYRAWESSGQFCFDNPQCWAGNRISLYLTPTVQFLNQSWVFIKVVSWCFPTTPAQGIERRSCSRRF